MGQDAEAEDDSHCQALETAKKGDPKVAHGIQAEKNLGDTDSTALILCPLCHCKDYWTVHLCTSVLAPDYRTHYLDTHAVVLESMWV